MSEASTHPGRKAQ